MDEELNTNVPQTHYNVTEQQDDVYQMEIPVNAGVAKVKEFAEASRGADGNLRFDVLTQANRANHMTVIESWSNAAAKEAHISSSAARAFRQNLMPMSGALYDEREYSALHC